MNSNAIQDFTAKMEVKRLNVWSVQNGITIEHFVKVAIIHFSNKFHVTKKKKKLKEG